MSDPQIAAQVVASTSWAVLVVGADGIVEYANPAVTRVLGWTPDELQGRGVDDVLHRDPTAPAGAIDVAPTAGRPGRHRSGLLAHADGSLVPVTWTADPLLVAGAPTGSVVLTFTGAGTRAPDAAREAVTRARDRAELWSAQQAISDLGWIAELTRVMSSTMDEPESLRRLARVVTPRLADVAIVDMVDDQGRWHRVDVNVAAGLDLDVAAIVARPDVQHGPADQETRRTAAGQAVIRLDAAQMADPAVLSSPSRNLLAALGARTMLVTPLAARNRLLGYVGLVRLAPDAYSDDEVLLAADVGRRAGLVLDNNRLYEEQRRAAEQLQLALLPQVHSVAGMQVAARYVPAADRFRVGGDWYDLFTDQAGAQFLVVGDVAGHDLAAAATMAALRNLVRGVAVADTRGPADVLATVDGAMRPLDIAGTASALAVKAERSPDAWSLTWSNAGHPPAALVVPGVGGVRLLDVAPDPLLGTESAPGRHDHTTTVPFGSVLVLYTDGLIEKRGEDIDRGLDRLRDALAAEVPGDVEEILASVLSRTAPGDEDDVAVLVARFT